MLVVLPLGLVLADDDAPYLGSHSESSFKMRPPSEAPAGFGDLILLAFAFSFVGLGISIAATSLKTRDMVLPYRWQARPEMTSDIGALHL
jgi:hypothetical protein